MIPLNATEKQIAHEVLLAYQRDVVYKRRVRWGDAHEKMEARLKNAGYLVTRRTARTVNKSRWTAAPPKDEYYFYSYSLSDAGNAALGELVELLGVPF